MWPPGGNADRKTPSTPNLGAGTTHGTTPGASQPATTGGASPPKATIHLSETLRGRELVVHVSGPASGRVRISFTGQLMGRLVASGAKIAALKHGALTATFKLGPRTSAHATIRVSAKLDHQRAVTSRRHRQAPRTSRDSSFRVPIMKLSNDHISLTVTTRRSRTLKDGPTNSSRQHLLRGFRDWCPQARISDLCLDQPLVAGPVGRYPRGSLRIANYFRRPIVPCDVTLAYTTA
jgi:hypothetical protein